MTSKYTAKTNFKETIVTTTAIFSKRTASAESELRNSPKDKTKHEPSSVNSLLQKSPPKKKLKLSDNDSITNDELIKLLDSCEEMDDIQNTKNLNAIKFSNQEKTNFKTKPNSKPLDAKQNNDIPSFVFIVADIQNSPSFVQLKMLAYKFISNQTSGIVDSSKINEIIKSENERNTNISICNLHDSWVNTNVQINDVVHILADEEPDGTYKINDSKGYIIVNPHHILSGTTIISSLSCIRKSALNWKFKDTGFGTSQMVLGNLLHMLFQHAIKNKKYEKSELHSALIDMLKRKQIINQLYEANLDEEFILKETSVYLSTIEKWLHEHIKLPSSNKSNDPKSAKNFQIASVCDIEESIWSPKFGLKGKLDLTLQTEIKISAYKNLVSATKKPSNLPESYTIPVELKSGRTTFSAEHEGQVVLYSLLNEEKRKLTDFGLLLYLKDMNMKFIKVNHTSLRGLLQLRNELVYYISTNKLPELKNEERFCSKCSQLVVCSLFNDIQGKEEGCIELYSNTVKHLADSHKKYFLHWYTMLEHEFKDQKQFDAGEFIWWESKEDLETAGWSVFDLRLKINNTQNSLDDIQYEGEGFFTFDFYTTESSNKKETYLKENDMILLTSQTDKQIGIAQGFIKSIRNNNTLFTLLVDKNFNSSTVKLSKEHLFRIDKINFRSAISLNYNNLARLMTSEDKCKQLRAFIIDKAIPSFETVLPKQYILKTRSLFKKLNPSQQAAIIKTIMAHDYLLIKGYPGTGKTTTIAALIAILIKLEKKILFTSFTNSAVDNLLLKLKNDYSIDFVRIGSFERIHPEIQKYESNFLTSKMKNVQELDQFYKEKELIATTCSSISHPVFKKIDFDYCIVDEASQVLLTTCLGPLFSSKKFVLVGDLEQLPPIIKNKEARLLGMGVSLFEWLNCKEGSVELVHQYRMNKDIMDLANKLTYNGKLECISETTANSCIKMNDDFLSSITHCKIAKAFTNPIVFIDTSELMKTVANDGADQNENRVVNKTEIEIVYELCRIFFKKTDCNNAEQYGIISPYNNQVKEIKKKLSGYKSLQDIEVNTVDQFQGRDKRLVMLSFTNSLIKDEDTKEFEILNDKRRLTVAITRAKEKLILIGSISNLVRYKPLVSLISYMKEMDYIVNMSDLNFLKSIN